MLWQARLNRHFCGQREKREICGKIKSLNLWQEKIAKIRGKGENRQIRGKGKIAKFLQVRSPKICGTQKPHHKCKNHCVKIQYISESQNPRIPEIPSQCFEMTHCSRLKHEFVITYVINVNFLSCSVTGVTEQIGEPRRTKNEYRREIPDLRESRREEFRKQ